MQAMTIAWMLRREKEAVARRHEIEKQLRKLESLPTEPSRNHRIKKLREELAGG
jgi:DNA-binding response OmpR family regulator